MSRDVIRVFLISLFQDAWDPALETRRKRVRILPRIPQIKRTDLDVRASDDNGNIIVIM